jgi:hypothetical protein
VSQADGGSHDAHSAARLHERPVQLEMDQLFREPTVYRNYDSVIWWQQNYHRFPLLASLARRFLAAPTSSVASERLFSTAGDVLTDSRSCPLPE